MLTSVLSNAGKVTVLLICTQIWRTVGEAQGTGWEAAWEWIGWTVAIAFALYITLDTWLDGRDVVRLSRTVRTKNREIARLKQEIEGYQRGQVIALGRERDVRRYDNDQTEEFSAGYPER